MTQFLAWKNTCNMQSFILDTHTLIWFSAEDTLLTTSTYELIADPKNNIFISVASLWEMAIKKNLGKLELKYSFAGWYNLIQQNGFQVLQINQADLDILETLPHIHKDPFDRMLVAQASTLQATIITKDIFIVQYPISTIW